jgi:AcrR family transcriptional regulator
LNFLDIDHDTRLSVVRTDGFHSPYLRGSHASLAPHAVRDSPSRLTYLKVKAPGGSTPLSGGSDGAISARERILNAAAQLFYRDGFVGVGVDTIIAESGVAKMTLYRHFRSKDDLIVAYLERADEQFWVWFDESLGRGNRREQLLHLFESLGDFAMSPQCFGGCMFQHAAADFPDPDHRAHRVALEHKAAVLARLHDLGQQAGASDPRGLAAQLLLLMDGAFVAARMFGTRSPAAHVGTAAAAIIRSHVSGDGGHRLGSRPGGHQATV